MRISGTGGRVRVGYQTAATLAAWTLIRTASTPEPAYTLTAALTRSDTFWNRQGPMDLELTMGQRAWIWSQVTPTITAESLAVTLRGVPAIH